MALPFGLPASYPRSVRPSPVARAGFRIVTEVAEPRRSKRGPRLRPRRDEAIAALAAIALFVLLFVPWYDLDNAESQLSLPGASGDAQSAWEALDLLSPLLALVSVLSLALVLAHTLKPGWKPAISPGAAVAVLGGLATLLVLVRVVFPPDLDGLVGVEVEATPTLGAFLGLAAAFAIGAGGYRAMRAEGSSFAAVADSLQPRRERPASRKR